MVVAHLPILHSPFKPANNQRQYVLITRTSDRPRFTRAPQHRSVDLDSGTAPEMVTLSSRATRVRSAKLRRAAAYSDQPPRVPSRRRMRRKHTDAKLSRRLPAKVC